MRKNLFHPTQIYQEHRSANTRGESQLCSLYAMQPEHVVHNVFYRIEEQEQDLAQFNSIPEQFQEFKK
ncbi:MAG: hypothetical protein KKH01_09595 [Firmicutes bacterium]|nr:hypothetical protein [Bacillota bacterium]